MAGSINTLGMAGGLVLGGGIAAAVTINAVRETDPSREAVKIAGAPASVNEQASQLKVNSARISRLGSGALMMGLGGAVGMLASFALGRAPAGQFGRETAHLAGRAASLPSAGRGLAMGLGVGAAVAALIAAKEASAFGAQMFEPQG